MGPAVISLGVMLGFWMRRLRSGRTTASPPFQAQCEKVAKESLGRVAVGTVGEHSWQRGLKYSFSSRCQSL